ncbi:putative fungal pheromone GPCR, STE3-type [Sparassis latifolia]
MAADPTCPLYSVITFISFVLTLVPLPWHFQAWNSGTCYFMMWTSLACLNQFVNSLVWADDVLNVAPIWCDISTRIIIGVSVGIPAASLCINRRLYKIARSQGLSSTRSEKRRIIMMDTLICVLFPLVYVALSYIVQGHRFDIYEVLGCYPAIFNTLPAYFLVYMWPIIIGLVSAVYCSQSLWHLLARQAQFKEFLPAVGGLTRGRYMRLMALAMTDIVLTIPFGAYELYSNASGGAVQPWGSWANAHYNFSRVDQYPAVLWMRTPSLAVPLQLSRWMSPLCAVVFFAYFGFADEARRNYAIAWRKVVSFVRVMLYSKRRSNVGRAEMLPAYSPSVPSHIRKKSFSSDVLDFVDTTIDHKTTLQSPKDLRSSLFLVTTSESPPLPSTPSFLPCSPPSLPCSPSFLPHPVHIPSDSAV